jgi:hypothetical protein
LESAVAEKDVALRELKARVAFLEGSTKDARVLDEQLKAEKTAHKESRVCTLVSFGEETKS